ncbi:MAG: nucleotide sugar dehydrogenase [Chloroflexi bacterium]|nr:nucleotide sugar dehydrogenase [Chloroflexota bacterium]MDA1219527.1 nucleotide sugar dehydrogenase [Chloroflexota bacterium]
MNKGYFGVIGLGYVGLPLAIQFTKAGYHVVGIDLDEKRISQLKKGKSYIGDISDAEVESAVNEGLFLPTTDYSSLRDVEAMSICVPTPLRKTREPDVSFVVSVAERIAEVLQKDQTVILESTVYPGATNDLVAPILEQTSGLKAGQDFYLAFSPERVDPGNDKYQIQHITKLVGGVNQASTDRAVEFYRNVFTTVLPLTSAKEAEMAKLLENTFRAVNIGLVNELATMAHGMNIDFWQVIDAAATKPFGFMPFYPGPGWGGHCIPVDPFYLSWTAKANGLETGFIDHAGHINDRMPGYVVQRVSDLLNNQSKCLRGAKIMLIGVAYKRDVADLRESPALAIIDAFHKKGAEISYHDPFVPNFDHIGQTWHSQDVDTATLREQDCVVIVTDHTSFDYAALVRDSSLIFDTRNATRNVRQGHANVEVL